MPMRAERRTPLGRVDGAMAISTAFIRSIRFERDRVTTPGAYPFDIPAIATLLAQGELPLHPRVTFFVGENGSGKSTLLEAIAIAARFNAEGGSPNFRFATRPSESELHRCLWLLRGIRRPKTGFFMRAESFFNVATEVERLSVTHAYGDRSLHVRSHGEAFLALVEHRFWPDGLYLLDEPEAALSPQRQLSMLTAMHRLVKKERCQMVIATHSPLLLAYPDAQILMFGPKGLEPVTYEQTEHYALTRDFLADRDRYLRRLLEG